MTLEVLLLKMDWLLHWNKTLLYSCTVFSEKRDRYNQIESIGCFFHVICIIHPHRQYYWNCVSKIKTLFITISYNCYLYWAFAIFSRKIMGGIIKSMYPWISMTLFTLRNGRSPERKMDFTWQIRFHWVTILITEFTGLVLQYWRDWFSVLVRVILGKKHSEKSVELLWLLSALDVHSCLCSCCTTKWTRPISLFFRPSNNPILPLVVEFFKKSNNISADLVQLSFLN